MAYDPGLVLGLVWLNARAIQIRGQALYIAAIFLVCGNFHSHLFY